QQEQTPYHRTHCHHHYSLYTSTAAIHPPPLHDALPILKSLVDTASHLGGFFAQAVIVSTRLFRSWRRDRGARAPFEKMSPGTSRSEEHTSELQSRGHLVCRLLLEKKKPTVVRSRTSWMFCVRLSKSTVRASSILLFCFFLLAFFSSPCWSRSSRKDGGRWLKRCVL